MIHRILVVTLVLLAFGTTQTVRAEVPADYRGKPFTDAYHKAGVPSIPGIVQCALYDLGGEGVAYHDTDTANNGSGKLNLERGHQRAHAGEYLWFFRKDEGMDLSFVKDGADLSHTNLVSPHINQLYIGWTENGEWVNYTVNVARPGLYRIKALYSFQTNAVTFDLNGRLAATCRLPVLTANYHQWNFAAIGTIEFPEAGQQLLTFHYGKGNNFAYFEFEPVTTAADHVRGQALPAHAAVAASDAPQNWTTKDDHRNMMDQLGITRLRPGPSGNASATNSANYDPAKANPFPNLPDPLTLKDGRKVTTAGQWWKERRPEIVEDFECEVFGRVPKNVPKVTWSITNQATDRFVTNIPVNARQLVGKVDNSAYPSIEVNIQMTIVTPLNAKRPVPVLMMFGGFGSGGFPRRPGEPEPTNRFGGFGNVTFSDPPSTEQLIASGWGYATISLNSIQADNGAGLTKGIIGLVNKGQPRKPDDWGSLRAWAWGAARGLDYLETDPTVNAKQAGIEGVSRYGKAALVALAFEPRFAMALVGSSGEGGAKLHRRNFGEAVENLTGSGEYHWMAGNFLKYGTAESTFGSKNAGDLPVDAHQLIALCAPQPTFISYGIPEKGDANWLDQQGSYMATVAAGPVFRLLGARDLGVTEDYRTAQKPPVNTGLLDGELAWRQHDGGHEDRSNMKHFLTWANKLIQHTPPAPSVSK